MGRVVLVTGGARGLGQAYCVGFARRGFRVATADILDVTATVTACGPGACTGFHADVTRPEEVERLVAEVTSACGPIDALVNNVGGFPTTPFLDLTYERWRELIALNLDSAFLCCRAVAPGMIDRRHGRIVNVASGTVFKGNAGLAPYVSAKAGVIGLTRVLASELGEYGITVNCVAPGLTVTDGARGYTDDFAGEQANIARRSVRRREVPEDVVGAVCFFASDDAAFVTGQTLVVDGGNVKH